MTPVLVPKRHIFYASLLSSRAKLETALLLAERTRCYDSRR
jgi:hypothetical protein